MKPSITDKGASPKSRVGNLLRQKGNNRASLLWGAGLTCCLTGVGIPVGLGLMGTAVVSKSRTEVLSRRADRASAGKDNHGSEKNLKSDLKNYVIGAMKGVIQPLVHLDQRFNDSYNTIRLGDKNITKHRDHYDRSSPFSAYRNRGADPVEDKRIRKGERQ